MNENKKYIVIFHDYLTISYLNIDRGGILTTLVANMLDSDIVVSKFKLWSCYYVHFRTNTLEKPMNPLIPQLWVK